MESNLFETCENEIPKSSSQTLINACKSLFDDDVEDNYDSVGEYFFESPRLAYKTDPDYKNLVQAIVVIEAAQNQAKENLQKLCSLRHEALDDSSQFVEKVKTKDVQISTTPKPPCIPSIDWEKYSTFESNFKSRRRYNSLIGKTNDVNQTFNQPWTVEEQSRLEELLLMFPPEEIESRRWKKISKELGTRTPIQVASRVQKYFEKLYKAGFPIPGHHSSLGYLNKKYRKMSSWQSNSIATATIEDDNSRGSFNSAISSNDDNLSDDEAISDIEDINPELRNSVEFQELLLVRKALKRKLSNG